MGSSAPGREGSSQQVATAARGSQARTTRLAEPRPSLPSAKLSVRSQAPRDGSSLSSGPSEDSLAGVLHAGSLSSRTWASVPAPGSPPCVLSPGCHDDFH